MKLQLSASCGHGKLAVSYSQPSCRLERRTEDGTRHFPLVCSLLIIICCISLCLALTCRLDQNINVNLSCRRSHSSFAIRRRDSSDIAAAAHRPSWHDGDNDGDCDYDDDDITRTVTSPTPRGDMAEGGESRPRGVQTARVLARMAKRPQERLGSAQKAPESTSAALDKS